MPSEIGRKHFNALSELYKNDIASIPEDIRSLRLLTKDDASQHKRIDSLVMSYNIFNRRLNYRTSGVRPTDSSYNLFLNALIIQRLIDNGVREQKEQLHNKKAKFEQSARKTSIITVVFIFTSIILIIGIAFSNIYEVNKREGVESFLESVLNTSQNGIITYRAIRKITEIEDFDVIFTNDAVVPQLGAQYTGLTGKTFYEAFASIGHKDEIFRRFVHVTETGMKDDFEGCYEINHNKRWFKIVLAKLNDGLTSTFYDITKIKAYQEELQLKVEQLQHSNNELEQFAFVASHDLQEPLRKIKTFASFINERFNEPSASNVKMYLNKVIDSANRMSNLIQDLLHFSHLTKAGHTFQRTDLNYILRNILKDFELVIEEKKAIISFDRLPILDAIPLQMNQLFFNLINNALKFSKPEMQPVIKITSKKLPDSEVIRFKLDRNLKYYAINVRDNGIGFKQEYAEKVFVIFQRLNNQQEYSGSGIGLALCRKIVLNHNGTMYAESRENEGASFSIILPVHQPVEGFKETFRLIPAGEEWKA